MVLLLSRCLSLGWELSIGVGRKSKSTKTEIDAPNSLYKHMPALGMCGERRLVWILEAGELAKSQVVVGQKFTYVFQQISTLVKWFWCLLRGWAVPPKR